MTVSTMSTKNVVDDSIPAVLRRRYKQLFDEKGYNREFCKVFERAANELDRLSLVEAALDNANEQLRIWKLEEAQRCASLNAANKLIERLQAKRTAPPETATPYEHTTDICRRELENIANAKRFNKDFFENGDEDFASWAQSRARDALARSAQPVPVPPSADALRNNLLNSLHEWQNAGGATAEVRDAIDCLIMTRLEHSAIQTKDDDCDLCGGTGEVDATTLQHIGSVPCPTCISREHAAASPPAPVDKDWRSVVTQVRAEIVHSSGLRDEYQDFNTAIELIDGLLGPTKPGVTP